MTHRLAIFTLALDLLALSAVLGAQPQEETEWSIGPLNPGDPLAQVEWSTNGIVTATHGVLIRYGGAVLTAETVALHEPTGEAIADGNVRIQQGEQLWL